MALLHQILSPDISSKIFENLAPGPKPTFEDFPAIHSEWRIRRHTLAVSARVCTLFTAPALDVLWETLNKVDPLFALLPTYSPSLGTFTDVIADEHWQRFEAYALRVRKINVLAKDQQYSHREMRPYEEAWTIILQKAHHSPILPRLQQLTIDAFAGGLLALLTPTLTHLHIKLNLLSPSPSPTPLARGRPDMMISLMQPFFAHIRSLAVDDNVPLMEMPGRIDICTLTHLQCVRISQPLIATPTAIQSLMRFPSLRELALNFEFSVDALAALTQSGLAPGFFELRVLHLTASFEDIATFLDATDPAGLDSLTLVLGGRFYRGHGAQTFEGLHNAYSKIPRHIRRLHLCLLGDGHYFVDERSLPELAISRMIPAILRTLPDLQELSMRYRGLGASLRDEDLSAFCTAWPVLTRLEFNCGVGGDELTNNGRRQEDFTAFPTFSTLLAFTEAHPHLTQLGLPVLNAEDVPGLEASGAALAAAGGHKLRHLRLIAISRRAPLIPLAFALDRAFPHLQLGYAHRVSVQTLTEVHDDDDDDESTSRSQITAVDVLMTLVLTLQTVRGMAAKV